MSSVWVVLDTKSEVGARRVGRVAEDDAIASQATELTVQWPDGNIERLKMSASYRKLRLDSLSAMAELMPDQLTRELESSPLVFARALVEMPKARLREKDLLVLVATRGKIEKSVVEAAWKKHRAAFESLLEVDFEQTASGPKYYLRAPLGTIDVQGGSTGEVRKGEVSAPEPSGTARTEDRDVSGDVTSRLEENPVPASGVSNLAETMDNRQDTAVIVDALSSKSPVRIDKLDLDAWFASKAPSKAIAEGSARLDVLPHDDEGFVEAAGRYSILVGRILKRNDVTVSPEILAGAFVSLWRSGQDSLRQRGMDALEAAIARVEEPSEFFARVDQVAIQAALAELPIRESGLRGRFLLVVARAGKSRIEDAAWWRGLSWEDVLEGSSGRLSTVLTTSDVLLRRVRAVADEHASQISTRRGLFSFLSGPRFAIEHIPPTRVRELFDRVGQQDSLLAGWHSELSASAEREDLNDRLQAAQAELDRVLKDETNASAELSALSKQLESTQLQLEAARVELTGLSVRERRQLNIEAAKTIAQIAATVDAEARETDHDALTQKVNRLSGKFGLRPSAMRGESVVFDPALHNAPGTRPEVEELVNVARAGYIWEDGDEQVVVLPALVTRAGKSEGNA